MTTQARRQLIRAAMLIAPAVIAVAACSGFSGKSQVGCKDGIFDVTVTMPMFAEFACSVGGDLVNVRALIPLDGDPHSYVPPAEDAELVSGAKLVLSAGLGLDQPSRDFILEHGRGSAQLIVYSRSITSPTVEQPPVDQPVINAEVAGDNPYLWLDPRLARAYVDITRDSLEIIDPEHITEYRKAADAYFVRLAELEQDIMVEFTGLPLANRKLVTLHDSMEHFAKRFTFEVAGFLTAPGETPSAGEIEALAAIVRDQGVPAVFTERGYDEGPMQQVADAAGVELCSLYTDRADSDAFTYIDMMRANMDEISRCLDG